MPPMRCFSRRSASNPKFIGEFLLSRRKIHTVFPRIIPSLPSKVLPSSFPWRNRTNPTFDFSPISQTKHFSSIDVAKEIDPFTVSYLINSCGLSSESAKLASKHFQLKNSSNPDSVLDCLKNYGFSDADIKKVARRFPIVLRLKAETNLKPKMEFLLSIGVKGEEIATIVCRNPRLLGSSLDKRIIPCYEFFKRVLVHDELVVKSLRFVPRTGKDDLEKNVVPNFELLKKVGVPEPVIQFILIHAFGLLGLDNAEFSKRVNRVISMGFEPSKYSFVEALRFWPKKSTWERKAQVCRSWGWSDSDVSLAFRKNPGFMTKSVEKLTAVMDFLVNKMGWDPSDVAAAPYMFSYSLEKNTIPRCSVVKVLQLKGLIEKKISLYAFMAVPKKRFLDRFVFRYREQAPQLLDIFEGKVDL